MFFGNGIKWLGKSKMNRPASRRRFRPECLLLENRLAPATLTVNTLADAIHPGNGTLTLRDAISAINQGNSGGLTAGEQHQVSGAYGNHDTIAFAAGLTGSINLANGQLTIASNMAITGPGANLLSVTGQFGSRVFLIQADSVSLSGLTITGGNLLSGIPDSDGGGIWFRGSGTLHLDNVAITGNLATSGGGIRNDGGAIYVTNSTISDNQAGAGGVAGGIWNNGGTLYVTNSTIANNVSQTNEAGAIWNHGGTTILSNATIAGNSARLTGGAIWNQFGTVQMQNTIVAGNSASSGPDIGGVVDSQGHNLIGNTSGAAGFVGSDLLNVNPLLGSLGNNGGPTNTMALLAGSPAIDAGSNSLIPAGITSDQRGFRPRIINGAVDIGAYEVNAASLKIVQSVSPASIATGSHFTYSITVTNLGTSAVSGVTIRDLLPTNAVFSGASGFGYSINGGVLTINIGTLAANSSKTILLDMFVPKNTPVGTRITNFVSARASAAGALDLDSSSLSFTTVKPAFTKRWGIG